MISNDQADIMLVGGLKMATSPVGLGGFCAARALSTRTTSLSVRVAHGIKIEMASCSAMARASW